MLNVLGFTIPGGQRLAFGTVPSGHTCNLTTDHRLDIVIETHSKMGITVEKHPKIKVDV